MIDNDISDKVVLYAIGGGTVTLSDRNGVRAEYG